MKHRKTILPKIVMFVLIAALAAFPLIGCTGSKGDSGSKGKAGTSKGNLTGTVTNNITNSPVSDVSVTLDPTLQGVTISTDNNGDYSASLPAGNYTITYSKSGFTSQSISVSILAGVTSTNDIKLVPSANVIVDAGADTSGNAGGSVSLSANAEPLDGSTCTSYDWSQTAGATATITNGSTATPTITLASTEAYKDALYTHLEDLNRTMVQGLNNLSVDEGNEATFKVTVTCGSSTYSDSINITVSNPWLPNPGIENVAKEVPVLLHGRDMGDSTWTWSFNSKPNGSTAAFDNANSRNPVFTPDLDGLYQVSVTNTGSGETDSLDIYAGEWVGVITGIDNSGNPIPDTGCTQCHHDGGSAPDMFTPWAKSGHAEIMSQNLDTPNGHWSLSCAPCHTVGYNTNAANNGFDDVASVEGWTPPAHGEPGTWEAMVASGDYPNTVRHSNIQCENCHGPNNSDAHHSGNADVLSPHRVSLSADVCGSCHGEPARHGRYQQWQESGHGDTNFATDESVDSNTGYARSCALCHSANGFIAWEEEGYAPDADDAVLAIVNGDAADAGKPLKDMVFSQTCQACHTVHDPGDTSGEPNNAKVRVSGTTPETKGGFIAANVGRGAVCMMCHNSRRGGYNTTMHPDYYDGNMEMIDETPHHGPQSDVLMGENGFFVDPGDRSPHSYIVDTCTTCHMELTPPPAEYSYELSGTNHDFKASITICSDCHGTFDGGTLQANTEDLLTSVSTGLDNAVMNEVNRIEAVWNSIGANDTHDNGVLIDYDSDTVTASDIVNTTDMVTAVTTSSRGRFNITVASHSAVSSVNLSNIVVWVDTNDNHTIDANEVFTGDTDGEGIVDSCIGVGTPYSTAADAVANCSNNNGVLTNGQTIAKANWNYVLIDQDGSKGVHNPGFVHDLLQNTINALNSL